MNHLLLREAAALILLLYASISDLRIRQIHTVPVLLAALCGMLVTFVSGEIHIPYLMGFVPGAFFLGMAFLTRGGIGTGDALILLGLGAWLPWDLLLCALLCALLASAVCSVIFMTVLHRSWSHSFPFVPFLMGGTLFTLCFLYRAGC